MIKQDPSLIEAVSFITLSLLAVVGAIHTAEFLNIHYFGIERTFIFVSMDFWLVLGAIYEYKKLKRMEK